MFIVLISLHCGRVGRGMTVGIIGQTDIVFCITPGCEMGNGKLSYNICT